jgi:hypothetical protein
MSSTRWLYPQVVSRLLASFRVLDSVVFAGQRGFCAWFDFRQLHQRKLVTAKSLGQLSFSSTLVESREGT